MKLKPDKKKAPLKLHIFYSFKSRYVEKRFLPIEGAEQQRQ